MRRRCLAFSALAAAACADAETVLLVPEAPAGAETLLLLHVVPEAPAQGLALEASGASLEADLALPSVELALYFREDAAALGWPVAQRFESDPSAGVRVPTPMALFRRDAGGYSRELDADELREVYALRIPASPGAPCAAETACFVGDPFEGPGLFCGPSCAPFELTPPTPPERPRVRCPSGFREAQTTALAPPQPWCDVEIAACGARSRALLEGGCAAVGPACAPIDGRWPSPPPGAALAYVASDARAGEGDGSLASPWSLDTALERARDGDTLLLSTGEHTATRALDRALRLRGVCAASTTLRATVLTVSSSVSLEASGVVAHGVELMPGAALTIEGAAVIVDEYGIGHRGSSLRIHDALWRAAAGVASIRSEGRVELEELELRESRLELVDGASGSLRRVIVHAALGPDPLVYVAGGARAELVEGALYAPGATGSLLYTTTATAHVRALRAWGASAGLLAADGAYLRVEGAWLGPHRHVALIAATQGRADASDVVVFQSARAADAASGGELRASRWAVERVKIGVLGSGAPRLALSDLSLAELTDGVAADAQDARLERVHVRSATNALSLRLPAEPMLRTGVLVVRDLDVERTSDIAIYLGNSGMNALPAGPTTLERVRVRDARGSGLHVDRDIALTARDLEIARVTVGTELRYDACDVSPRLCRGTGIVLRAERASFERFRLDGLDEMGIDCDLVRELRARDGFVRAPRVGIADYMSSDWRDRYANVELLATIPVLAQ